MAMIPPLSCSGEGFDVRVNVSLLGPVSCSGELCGVRVIPAVDVAVVQVKAARRCCPFRA
jgi:hypothetical protein